MDENPYQSPREGYGSLDDGPPPMFSRVQRFLIGCGVLLPVSWLLGRALIPPDDVALRFSMLAWPVLSSIWGLFVWRIPVWRRFVQAAARFASSGDENSP